MLLRKCGTWSSESVSRNHMDIFWYRVDPGGNITAIVATAVPISRRRSVTNKILNSDPSVEQVGFWVAPRGRADARLEMAGGELCGNALRSIGAVLAHEGGDGAFRIETEVLERPILVTVESKRARIAFPKNIFTLSDDVCHLPGISHILGDSFSAVDEKSVFKAYGLLSKKAAGLISYAKKGARYFIEPIVRVKSLSVSVRETACASGTLALAMYLYKKDGTKEFFVRQPSGAVFDVSVGKSILTLSGPIRSIRRINGLKG